jgi:hypothetical protein
MTLPHMGRTARPSAARPVLGHEPLNVQVPLSGLYEVAGEVPAPERLVRAFGHHPRMV